MEQWQEEYIKANLVRLLKNTNCDTLLLASLLSEKVITDEEEDKINSKSERFEKTKLLYNLIQTRENGYPVLTNSLHECRQSGAVKILLTGYIAKNIENPLGKCNIGIDYEGVLSTEVHFQGKLVKLGSVFENFDEELLKTVFRNGQHDADYIEYFMFKNKQMTLLIDTVPKTPPFYISRCISNRVTLNKKIFSEKCSDVFVFKGVERHHLTELASPKATAKSSAQLLEVTSRFILLECQKDWEVISKISNFPTHLINFEQGSSAYIVEATTKNTENLLKYINTDKEKRFFISEEEFLEKIDDDKSITGICICDAPGMGKSLLLANLASKIQEKDSKRIVAFIRISELVFIMSQTTSTDPIDSYRAVEMILAHVSPTRMGQVILANALRRRIITLELFFDGVDEAPCGQFEDVKKFLSAVARLKGNIRVYITSRSHLRTELESTLGVVAYDLLSFTHSNQINFLVSQWKTENIGSLEPKLIQFAEYCLTSLANIIEERYEAFGILGNPIKCFLLAKSYSREAHLYSDPERPQQVLNISPKSVYQMYKEFIEMSIANCRKTDCQEESFKISSEYDQIKHFYVWKSLEQTFPRLAKAYAKIHHVDKLPPKKLCLPNGILETRSTDDASTVQFVHYTYAEFITAQYFAETLLIALVSTPGRNMARKTIYVFVKEYLFFHENKLMSLAFHPQHKFSNRVLTCFLNEMFNVNQVDLPNPQIVSTFFEMADPTLIFSLLSCSIVDNYKHLLKLFSWLLRGVDSMKLNEYRSFMLACSIESDNVFMQPLLLLICNAAEHSTVSVMDEFFQLCRDCFHHDPSQTYKSWTVDNEPDNIFLPLRLAVRRNDYEVVEYLVNNFPLANDELLYDCIESSASLDLDGVRNKINICKFLLGRNPTLLTSSKKYFRKDERGNTVHVANDTGPIVANGIHLEIIKFLIDKGADLYASRHALYTSHNIVHSKMYGRPYNSERFHEFCLFLIKSQRAFELFQDNPPKWECPIFAMLLHDYAVNEETILMILDTVEPNIEHTNLLSFGRALVKRAVWGNRTVSLIDTIIRKFNVHFEPKGSTADEILHLSAANNRIDLLEKFIQLGFSVNSIGLFRCPPLLLAGKNVKTLEYLISKGADLHSLNMERETVVHVAANSGMSKTDFHRVVTLILTNSTGLAVLCYKNRFGWTPLHQRLRNCYTLSAQIDAATVELLLQIGATSPNEVGNDGYSLLLSAIRCKRDIVIIRILLKHGANVNYQHSKLGSAIHFAAREENIDLVKLLIDYGSNVNSLSSIREAPLSVAIHGENGSPSRMQTVKYLIIAGADIYNTDDLGNTPVHNAAFNWRLDVEFSALVDFLLYRNHGDIFSIKNKANETPAHLRFSSLDAQIEPQTVNLLLNIPGVEVNSSNELGVNLFHAAVASGKSPKVLKALIQHGADYKALTDQNFTSLHLVFVCEKDCSERSLTEDSVDVLKYLLSLDINVDQKDKQMRTATDYVRLYLHLYRKNDGSKEDQGRRRLEDLLCEGEKAELLSEALCLLENKIETAGYKQK